MGVEFREFEPMDGMNLDELEQHIKNGGEIAFTLADNAICARALMFYYISLQQAMPQVMVERPECVDQMADLIDHAGRLAATFKFICENMAAVIENAHKDCVEGQPCKIPGMENKFAEWLDTL